MNTASGRAVQRALEYLDYVPGLTPFDPSPAGCAIGVVITESTTNLFGDPYFSTLIKGIRSALAELSILSVMLQPQSDPEMELAATYLTGKHVDGAILVGPHQHNPLPKRLREHRIPMVIQGRPYEDVAASCVDTDNRQGGALAVSHLVAQGRRRIATIAGNLDMTSAVDRLMGYRDALSAADIALDRTLEEVADYLPDRAHMAMERLLLNHPDVDAVFAASDRMAAAAMRVLRQAHRRIPEDVAVIGFDDSPTAQATRPPLSSIRQPIEEMGREAVNVLMREMAEPEEAPRHVIFATELVVRESTVGAGPSYAQGAGVIPSMP